jgi:hypothetical protein
MSSIGITQAIHFVERDESALLFFWVLAEQGALPIPSVPLLVAVEAFVHMGRLNTVVAIACCVAGALAADSVWFHFGRSRGKRVLAAAWILWKFIQRRRFLNQLVVARINEASSFRPALLLKSHGITQVRPLRGGLDAWESMMAARLGIAGSAQGGFTILESFRTPGHSKDSDELHAD